MVDIDAIFPAWLPVTALVAVRMATKALGVSVFGPLSGVSLKKGFLTGVALMPMSALALMLIQQVSKWNPQIAQQTTSVLLPSVARAPARRDGAAMALLLRWFQRSSNCSRYKLRKLMSAKLPIGVAITYKQSPGCSWPSQAASAAGSAASKR
jgi:type IV secretory pathway VirB3-like protein